MKKLIAAQIALLGAACASPAPPEDDPDSPRAAALARATALLEIGEADEALIITDKLIAENGSDRAALILAAEGNLLLVESGRSGTQYFLADAVTNLTGALEIDDSDHELWLKLADVQLKSGNFEEGSEAALTAAKAARAAGADPKIVCRCVLVAADCKMQTFVDARREELAADEELTPHTNELADGVLEHLTFAEQALPGEAHVRKSQVYQWLGQSLKALDELEAGMGKAPGHSPLHDEFQRFHFGMGRRAECAAAYRRMQRDMPGEPLLLWFGGRAEVALADGLRQEGSSSEALAAYDTAAESFGRYRAMRPDHADATDHWIAICRISAGRVAIDGGDTAGAEQQFDTAFAVTPKVAQVDQNGTPLIADSFGGTYLNGLALIGRALVEPSKPEALEAGLAFYERKLTRHADQWFLCNNAALTARDLGVAVERSSRATDIDADEKKARADRARQLYERSYELYSKAVELAPDDPRTLNDCGLMLVYHLGREFDRARMLFDRTIELGQPRLDAMTEDTDEGERNFLEEAVGDAYENIGVMMRAQGKPFAEYESFLKKAVTYYPNERRRSALLLRTRGGNTGRSVGRPKQADPREAAFEKARKQAAGIADQGDLNGALAHLDRVATALADYAPYRALMGSYSIRFAEASPAGSSRQELLWTDALLHLERAVQLDPEAVPPRANLARAQFEAGKLVEAEATADSLLSHLRSTGQTEEKWTVTAHRVRGEAAARVFVERARAGNTDEDLLRKVRTSFTHLEDAGVLDEATARTWAGVEEWAGASERALAVLARALSRTPESGDLLAGLVDTADRLQAPERAVDALATRTDALGCWYRGKARYLHAVKLGTDPSTRAQALAALDAAVADFAASRAANADFAASVDQWTVLCMGKKGVLLFADGDHAAAERVLLDAVRKDPSQVSTQLGGNDTIRLGILRVADRHYRAGNLGACERIYRVASTAVSWDADLANNHGLFARDHGTALEQDGDRETAKEMFEASYASYRRAAELDPESIRFRNDCALLLIYHLKRDLDNARDLLADAIRRGEKRLSDDPPGDPTRLRDLQESVGDCYQNLGYYHEKHGGDVAAARRNYEKSLTFYPFERRASTAHLRRIGAEKKQ